MCLRPRVAGLATAAVAAFSGIGPMVAELGYLPFEPHAAHLFF